MDTFTDIVPLYCSMQNGRIAKMKQYVEFYFGCGWPRELVKNVPQPHLPPTTLSPNLVNNVARILSASFGSYVSGEDLTTFLPTLTSNHQHECMFLMWTKKYITTTSTMH